MYDYGAIFIKNITNKPYYIVELGSYIIQPLQEINLLDSKLPLYYTKYRDAYTACFLLKTGTLYLDIQAGNIKITRNIKPLTYVNN